jgi:hypothetical protein
VSAQIGLRSPADADELFHIYTRIFGEEKTAARRASWAWQYERNPQSPGGPHLYVARRDEHPVGQMGTMPVSLWWGDREVRASWGIDYFVSPDAEGQGDSIALMKTWMNDVDVALALGLAKTTYLICKRLGFRDLGFVPFYQAVLDPAAIVRRRYGKVAGAAAAPITAAMKLARRPRAVSRDIVVTPATEIGTDYDRLWEGARETFAACVRRDAAYVRWRYGEAPHKAYRIIEARRGDTLTGFAVSRHEDYRGMRLGWIVDLFAASNEKATRDALIAQVMREFADANVARAQMLCTFAPLAEDLKRHGFFAGEAKGHLVARPNGVADSPAADPRRWHIVFGDGDWDR